MYKQCEFLKEGKESLALEAFPTSLDDAVHAYDARDDRRSRTRRGTRETIEMTALDDATNKVRTRDCVED